MTRFTLAVNDAQIDTAKRTITGTITRYGVRASASTGPVLFEPGSLTLAENLRRVKLLIDHDTRLSVGYCISSEISGDEHRATFYLPPGDQGDEALTRAADGTRDGLSVGAWAKPGGSTWDDAEQLTRVTAATVREVSLCALPAFDDARVSDVNATTTTPEGTTMDPIETPATEAEATPAAAPVAAAGAPEPVTVPTAPPITTTPRTANTAAAAAQLIHGMVRAGRSGAEITAALTDIIPANDPGKAFLRPQWIGELWAARKAGRPWIDSITRKALPATGLKVYGFQRNTRATVGAYAGDKAEIPTSGFSTKPVEVDVERIAGGWDIDRVYIDRGESSLIEALWDDAIEDYAVKTDAAVRTAIVAAATAAAGAETVPGALVELGAAASARGSAISFVACASDVWAGLAAMPKDSIPWWMGGGDSLNLGTTSGTVGSMRLFTDPALAAGQIVAGDARAATFWEDAPPVRVQAIDLPRGGIDLGLFGYHAKTVNDAGSLFKLTVTAPVEG